MITFFIASFLVSISHETLVQEKRWFGAEAVVDLVRDYL